MLRPETLLRLFTPTKLHPNRPKCLTYLTCLTSHMEGWGEV